MFFRGLFRSNTIETFTIVQDIDQIDESVLTSPLFKLTLKPRADKHLAFPMGCPTCEVNTT